MPIPERILCIFVLLIIFCYVIKLYQCKQDDMLKKILHEQNVKDEVLIRFMRFLVDEKVYQAFVVNFKKHQIKSDCFPDCLLNYCREHEPKDLLNHAFIWKDSNEGEKLWNKINDKWLKICDKNEKVDVDKLIEDML